MNPPEKTDAGKNMTKSVHEMSASARQVETVDGTGVPAVPNVLGTPDSRFSGRERSVDPANAGKQVRPAGSCGYLHVYTGDGKGKTTAAFGLAVRALCAGQSVYIGQFVKSMRSNETKIEGIFDRMRIEQLGRGCFIGHDPEPADVGMAREGLARCRALLVSGEYDLVILDELTIALYYRLLTVDEVLDALRARHPSVEVVVTGRYAPQELVDEADLVTEMREVKHYYTQGVLSREGIDR